MKLANTVYRADAEYTAIMDSEETASEAYSWLSKQYAGDLGIIAIGPVSNLALAYLYDN